MVGDSGIGISGEDHRGRARYGGRGPDPGAAVAPPGPAGGAPLAPLARLAMAAAVISAAGVSVGIVATRLRARRDASRRRFDLELDAATADVRARLQEGAEQVRRHDLANAFTAVEGAATILARGGLRPADRTVLNEVLESGLRRVRALLTGETGQPGFSLAGVAAAATRDPRWTSGLEVDVPSDLMGQGEPDVVEEAVRQLLAYGHRRSPREGTLRLRGERGGDCAILWVEDRGPQIPPRERLAILDRDRRAPRHDDRVTELHIAIRLTREQGGFVRIAERPGGGTSFGVCVPVRRD